MKLPSPAKLNLFLHITGQRENGYHDLQTLFQIIDFSDTIEFNLNNEGNIRLLPDIPSLPIEENLVFKAATLLQPYRKNSHSGIDIVLEKQLPMGGGIGGGSSNAATTLLALNTLWQCNLPLEKLAEIGLQLGADVPVFVMGRSAFAQGVGEQLHPMTLGTPYFLIVKPNCHVSTGQIFTDKHLTRDTPPIKISHVLMVDGHNDCLSVVKKHNPELDEAYSWLKQHGDVKLTGTGACLFISFDNRQDAERLKIAIPEKWQAWICQGCNLSPTHYALNQWIEKNNI